jgi:DNA-binding GntR family transcriptional regulator
MIKAVPLSNRAYEQLRDAIRDGELRPGEPLFEIHLAKSLGMSRTPVREALQLLVSDGYLDVLPGRGYVIPRRSLDDLREFFELREVLEAAASRYAAVRARPEEIAALQDVCDQYEGEQDLARWQQLGAQFHALITRACRNDRLANLMDSLTTQIDLSRRSVIYGGPAWRATAVQDHRAICAAITARDEAAAHKAAADHVRHSYQATLRGHEPEAYAAPKTP